MSIALQAKFLKVLQDKTFERLGSLNTIKTNARIIAATNKDLQSLVEEKKFREDLYYRLNVFPIIYIPPLRDRKKHIPEIANYLVKTISARIGKDAKIIPGDEIEKLINYSWPGNIRELKNVIERSIIVSRGSYLALHALEPSRAEVVATQKLEGDLKTIEKTAIKEALSKTGGNRKKTAEILGISIRSLQYKIKEYGL